MTSYVATNLDSLEPTPVCPGIRRWDFATTSNLRGWVIEFDPGAEWPDVDLHDAEERYFVLSGEVIEGSQRHPAGSYLVFPAGSRHQPRSESGARILGINVVAAG